MQRGRGGHGQVPLQRRAHRNKDDRIPVRQTPDQTQRSDPTPTTSRTPQRSSHLHNSVAVAWPRDFSFARYCGARMHLRVSPGEGGRRKRSTNSLYRVVDCNRMRWGADLLTVFVDQHHWGSSLPHLLFGQRRRGRACAARQSSRCITRPAGHGSRSTTPLPLMMSRGTDTWSCAINQVPLVFRIP